MEELDIFYNRHYITVDENNIILDGWSDGPHPEKDTSKAICINKKGGYQFRLYPDGEENPYLYDFMSNIPLYKYENNQVIQRSQEEIDEDIKKIPEPAPTVTEQLRADVDYLSVMTGIEL